MSEGILYLPLGNIHLAQDFRLLRTHPAEEGARLSCALEHFSIQHAPPYRAISYTWGDPFAVGERNNAIELEPILLDGKEVLVSKAVANVLKAMRDWHPADTAWVWADAICIDQNNVRERGQQVLLMPQIYLKADSVFVWLGPETDDSDAAIAILLGLAADRRLQLSRDAVLTRAKDPSNRANWSALAKFMGRRWWTRTWILQESVLARRLEFACGKRLMVGEDVLDGFGATQDFRDKIYDILTNQYGISLNVHSGNVIDGMSRMRAARLAGMVYNIQTCHFRSMSAEATDPRDYVYAKLGLASDGYFVIPEYESSTQTVYRNFVMGHIKALQSLDIIYFDARPRQTPGLPSWVPDWNARYGAEPLVLEIITTTDQGVQKTREEVSEGPSKPGIAHFDFGDDKPSRLFVDCCVFDEVDGVGRAGDLGWAGVTPEKPMVQSRSSQSAFGDEAATFDALWRTLTANKRPDGELIAPSAGTILAAFTAPSKISDPTSGPRFAKYFENAKDLKYAGRTLEDWMAWAREKLPTPSFTVDEQDEVELSFVDACYFRRVFTTPKGYAGVAPCETEPGDYLCILRGSTLPVILRRVSLGGDEKSIGSGYSSGDWSLIGAAYVHGIMDGGEDRDFVEVGIV